MRAISSRHPLLISLGAAVVAGFALWLSRASFDVAGTGDAPVRVAMLPGLAELAGLVGLCLLLVAFITQSVHRANLKDPSYVVAGILMPLFALSLLALPYLPWLAEQVPALRLLAGPGRALLWVVVMGQVTWLLFSKFAGRIGDTVGLFVGSLIVFGVSFAIFCWTFSRVVGAEDIPWIPLIFAAAVATSAWVAALGVSGSKGAATVGWSAAFLTAPFVLNSGTVFPAVLVDLSHALRQLPTANVAAMASGVPGLLFDQEFGMFAYAPILSLGFVGAARMAGDRSHRRVGIALIVATSALLVLAGSVVPWWSKTMMPGRTALLIIPLLAPPIAWLYARTGSVLPRSGLQILLLASVGVTLIIAMAPDRVPLPQEGDGSSSLLQWMSPHWQLWDEAPSFIDTPPQEASMKVILWIAVFTLLCWVFGRMNIASAGGAALFATCAAAVAALAVISTSAALPLRANSSPFNVEGRVIFPMLETFNPRLRPIALHYNPFSVISPADLPPLFSLAAVPGQRRDRQPVRVVLNARFRLPAGEYEIDVKKSDVETIPDASLGLQIGRDGPPLEVWPLILGPDGHFRRRFRVPLDAEFVGFRTARKVEPAIAELRLRARHVEAAPQRFRAPTVRSAADFGVARAFFHDGNAYPEREGFWAKGRTTTRLTIQKSTDRSGAVMLAIHSGARPNTVTLTTSDWSDRLELVPGLTSRIVIPSGSRELFIPLSITTDGGFVPAEVDDTSKDRRQLGAWIAFIRDDISRTSGVP
jgi:hypothetical protein